MNATVHRIVSGKWRENGYVIEGEDSRAVIIDPGLDTAAFTTHIAQRALTPCAIINTHAHYDHIGSVAPLMEAHGIPFHLHRGDAALLRQANLYRAMFAESETLRIPAEFSDLSEVSRLQLAGLDIEVLATPGHTKGSVCFRVSDHLFSGDTLLPNGTGRVDLPGGSATDMAATQSLLTTLPDDLLVHPGHGSIVPLRQIRERMKAA
ncbi:MAG: beta-lactamase domain protein [Bradyrhizobium sp.]|nr:beta-lactamase domain protein [Bradyrhizobium sp.]